MSAYELPLSFFTVLCQWSIGSIVALTVLLYIRPTLLVDTLFKTTFKKLSIGLFVLTAVGSCLSMLHLGSPLGAYRAILGIAHSWLSREVLAFCCLNGVVFFWMVIVLLSPGRKSIMAMCTLTSLVGIIAILVSAQVYYQMTARSLWHSLATHIAFLSTATLLGFTTISLWLNSCTKNSPLPRTLPASLLLSTLVIMCVLLYYAHGLAREKELLQSVRIMFSSKIFVWQILAGLVLAIITAMSLLLNKPKYSKALAAVLLFCILSGAMASRMLFYGSVMQQAPWF